jgi:hypothetical protein
VPTLKSVDHEMRKGHQLDRILASMSKIIHADLKNDTNHRNVFTITDTLIDQVLFANRNMDADEILPGVGLTADDDEKGHVKWEIKGQIGGHDDGVLDGDTVRMS